MDKSQTQFAFSRALIFQQTHLWLSALWNVWGAWMISHGQTPLGPTASYSTAAILIAFAAALCVAIYYQRWIYIGLSAVIVVAAASAVFNGFTLPAANWPSEFWRAAGITLNLLGVGAGVWAIFREFQNTSSN